MKKLTYRQKRDFLNKWEWLIVGIVQLISAIAGAITGVFICHYF